MRYEFPTLDDFTRVSIAILPRIGDLCPFVAIEKQRCTVDHLFEDLLRLRFRPLRRDRSMRLIMADMRTSCTSFVFDRTISKVDRSPLFQQEYAALVESSEWIVGRRQDDSLSSTTLFIECGFPAKLR